MSFAGVIGHTKQLQSLRAALSSNRLHHAYLFLGAEGVGKRTVAVALAQAIHCQESNGDSCGKCVNCARIFGANHPDVRLVEPLAGKKEITIQQVRELERELHFRSFTGKRKIAIVDPAAAMNSSAQNALLKTLEEPPENSLILLISANSGALLPTLRSRCLRLSFAPLAREEVAGFLRNHLSLKDDDAQFLAAMSMGSIGVAVSLDRATLIEKRRLWSGLLATLKSADYLSASAAAETLAGSREEALEFLRWADSWYRDLMVCALSDGAEELVNLDMRQQIEQQGREFGTQRALEAIARIADAMDGIQRNLNRRMVLEQLLFGIVGGR